MWKLKFELSFGGGSRQFSVERLPPGSPDLIVSTSDSVGRFPLYSFILKILNIFLHLGCRVGKVGLKSSFPVKSVTLL